MGASSYRRFVENQKLAPMARPYKHVQTATLRIQGNVREKA